MLVVGPRPVWCGIPVTGGVMTQAYQPQDDTGLPLRKLTHVIYALFALGTLSAGVFGVATLASVVLAYLKRGDAAGMVYAAHFDWVLSTFWWSVLWFLLSALATFIFVGWITGFIATVWLGVRIIRGRVALVGRRRAPTGSWLGVTSGS